MLFYLNDEERTEIMPVIQKTFVIAKSMPRLILKSK